MKATLHQGGMHTDERGILRFANEEVPGNYRRFYLITHTDITVIRAWQGHRLEEKTFYAISGSFTIAVLSPVQFEAPSDDEIPDFFELTEENNNFLHIPGGCYTGIKALTSNATLLVLSSFNLTDSKADDYRQPAHRWVNWNGIK